MHSGKVDVIRELFIRNSLQMNLISVTPPGGLLLSRTKEKELYLTVSEAIGYLWLEEVWKLVEANQIL